MSQEPIQFDCPYCLAPIQTVGSKKGLADKTECAACGRSVEVPSSKVENDLGASEKSGNKNLSAATKASASEDDLLAGFDTEIGDAEEDLNQLLESNDSSRGIFGEKGTFGIRCSVCDSRLLVAMRQVGTKVKCGDCFSMIKVRPPTGVEMRQIEKQIELNEADQAAADESGIADDLTLAPLETLADEAEQPFIDLPEADLIADAEAIADDEEILDDAALQLEPLELEPLETDSLELEPLQDDEPADVIFDDEDLVEEVAHEKMPSVAAPKPTALKSDGQQPATQKPATQKPATQKPNATKPDDPKPLDPYRSKSAQMAARRKKNPVYQPNQTASDKRKSKFPAFKFDALFQAAVELVSEQSVVARGMIAAALLAAGNIIAHLALADYRTIEAPTMGDIALMGVWRIGLGWTLFALGTLYLWYCAGVIFREAADGKKKIKSWKLGPSTEWTSTFLLTAFSFFVAGAPMLMLLSIFLTAPFRLLVALPFLTSVWYTQSPFMIISTDALGDIRKRPKHWQAVFSVVAAMASIAFVAGILMHVDIAYLNILTSALGAVFLAFVTLAYAAVAGWHSGNVVEQLN